MPVSGLIDTSLFKEQGIAQGMLVTVASRACGGCFCTCVLVYMWGGDEGSKGVKVFRGDLNCTRRGA